METLIALLNIAFPFVLFYIVYTTLRRIEKLEQFQRDYEADKAAEELEKRRGLK